MALIENEEAFLQAEAIFDNTRHSPEDYFALRRLAEESKDFRIGDLIEGFIASAPPGWRFPDENPEPVQ